MASQEVVPFSGSIIKNVEAGSFPGLNIRQIAQFTIGSILIQYLSFIAIMSATGYNINAARFNMIHQTVLFIMIAKSKPHKAFPAFDPV